jgi:hypothetical protein
MSEGVDDDERVLRREEAKIRPQKCANRPASVLCLELCVVHVFLWLGWGGVRGEGVNLDDDGDAPCSPLAGLRNENEMEGHLDVVTPYTTILYSRNKHTHRVHHH